MAKLTALKVRNAKPKEKPYKLSDGYGMYFHVSKSGKRTWRYRYKIAGIESTFTLGEYPKMTLEMARKARVKARELVSEGVNPATVRREKKQSVIEEQKAKAEKSVKSFEAVALEWMEKQEQRWSKDHANAVRATLERDAFPLLGKLSVDEIQPPMVIRVLRNIEARGALEIAQKVLQRMNAVFRYAVQTGKATYNPASDMKDVLKTRKVVHRAALSRDEMPEFLRALSVADIHDTTKLALQFTILTAVRSGETRAATWNEFDLDEAMWRIPGEKMKMATPHKIPLSTQALAILERVGNLFGREGYVFPGIRDYSKPLSENTMLYALYRMGYHSRATVHGFRAVFSTIANEAGFDGDVIEKALAHEQRNKVRAAYHRSEYLDQRRKLMQWWADLLHHMEHGAEIIPIREAVK